MPSLNISSPGVPTLLTGASPIAVTPVAAIDGIGPGAFASVIAGLGQGFTLDASPPLMVPVGTNLPSARPNVAGGPEPEPPVDVEAVEAVMIGSAGPVAAAPVPPVALPPEAVDEATPDGSPVAASADAAVPAVPVDAAAPPAPVVAPDQPALDSDPISCGLQIWRPHGASPLPLANKTPLPRPPLPVQLPPEEVADVSGIDSAPLPAQADKPTPCDPSPAQPADVPAQVPPFGWVPLPPQPVDEPPVPRAIADGTAGQAPAAAVSPNAKLDQPQPELPKLGTDAAPATPQAGPVQAQLPQPAQSPTPAAALPNSFAVPPEVAREIAQLVRAAVGERDERDGSATTDATPLPPISAPAPQILSSDPAPLHPSFVPAHRPVIDTGRAEWMQAMIDRIAEMPQSEGGRRDAQIRLVPDALGPVDVKIEQRQDRLHVTLQAETPQARQLLTDAAPKLHELAEARGIRFAQAGFGSTDSHDRRSAPEHQHQQPAPLRPRPAPAADSEPESQSDGDLIA